MHFRGVILPHCKTFIEKDCAFHCCGGLETKCMCTARHCGKNLFFSSLRISKLATIVSFHTAAKHCHMSEKEDMHAQTSRLWMIFRRMKAFQWRGTVNSCESKSHYGL
eukprot:scaffold318000_cov24-Prasinocladus_malaysianus.AAC.1